MTEPTEHPSAGWDPALRQRVWLAVSRLLVVAGYVDDTRPRPRVDQTQPEAAAWQKLRPVLDICHRIAVGVDRETGMWAAASETMEFGDVGGLITEARVGKLQPLREALEAVEPSVTPGDGTERWLGPLRHAYDATARELDAVEAEIRTDYLARMGFLPRYGIPTTGPR